MEVDLPASSTESSAPLHDLEKKAAVVVLAIQSCTGSLRNVKEFASLNPSALWTAVKKSAPSKGTAAFPHEQSNQINHVIANTDLYSKLVEDGVLAEVTACCGNNGKNRFQTNFSDSRAKLSHEILLPLAKALGDCYCILDRVPPPFKPPEPLSQRKFKSKQQAPAPPVGMLSLQNYTDIGAFLEFTVCTTILPFLEPSILFPAEDRARYFLPKSLAGRISKPSLLWGCRQINQNRMQDEELYFLRNAAKELNNTIEILGRLLLLDRFRPMLLPRHLADLYAAIFQSEIYENRMQQLTKIKTVEENKSEMLESILLLLLPYDTERRSSSSTNCSESAPDFKGVAPVDPGLQAQALQTLLLQGTKSPLWLRRRVSKQLTNIACQNLAAIVQVFVHAASPKDKTAAIVRLAHTLVTRQGNQLEKNGDGLKQTEIYDSICLQLVKLLDDSVDESLAHSNNGDGTSTELTSKQTLNIHIIWAILEQLPQKDMQDRMVPLLGRELLHVESKTASDSNFTIHRSVKRIATLLSSMPPSLNPSKIAQLFLVPMHEAGSKEVVQQLGTKPTIMSALVRLAALPPSVIKSSSHDDAVWALRLILHILMHSKFISDSGDNMPPHSCNAVEVAAMALVYSLAPSTWDLDGHRYVSDERSTGMNSLSPQNSNLDCISIESQGQPINNVEDMVSTIEARVKMVLQEIVEPLIRRDEEETCLNSESIESVDEMQSRNERDAFPSTLFHLVLFLYLTAIPSHPKDSVRLPAMFHQSGNESLRDFFKIIAMCTLPLLCEKCPPESLLIGNGDDGAGIFKMMQLVFRCASSYFSNEKILAEAPDEREGKDDDEAHAEAASTYSYPDKSFEKSGRYLSKILLGPDSHSNSNGGVSSKQDEDVDFRNVEMLLSITSLLLSLLIAILELGTKSKRLDTEEALLAHLPLLLRPLAESSDMSWLRGFSDKETAQSFSINCAEIAEMAAHAMALVSARNAPRSDDTRADSPLVNAAQHTEDIISLTLQEAEADLKSTQPPIRAKGVVSLQRMLRGSLLEELLSRDAANSIKKKLIVEVGKEESTTLELDKVIDEVLRLSALALSDPESYVYLAAVQAIVAAVDVYPSKVLLLVGSALANGVLRALQNDSHGEISLTPEQRVKLAEALMFCIQRRARVDEYLPTLLDLMIFGGKRAGTNRLEAGTVDQIQQETMDFFLLKKRDDDGSIKDDDDDEDLEERAEKQILRISTGGPLYRSEEADMVTAARISVVSELASVADPSVLSIYCIFVLRIATESLRLDASRPVRRAAAFLARELYRSLLREYYGLQEAVNDATGSDESSTELSLAKAMVTSKDDDVLAAALQRCVSAKDLGDISKTRFRSFDAATAARCEEALAARQEAVDGGLFTVARMLVDSRNLDRATPTKRLVRKLLGDHANDVVGALRGLKIDTETLTFK